MTTCIIHQTGGIRQTVSNTFQLQIGINWLHTTESLWKNESQRLVPPSSKAGISSAMFLPAELSGKLTNRVAMHFSTFFLSTWTASGASHDLWYDVIKFAPNLEVSIYRHWEVDEMWPYPKTVGTDEHRTVVQMNHMTAMLWCLIEIACFKPNCLYAGWSSSHPTLDTCTYNKGAVMTRK